MNTCILIGAGDFQETEILIDHDDYIVAVDGGYLNCLRLGITPHLLVADFDSMDKISFSNLHQSIPEKDDSDMMLAIKDGLAKGYNKFELYGALGGRFEHSYANIQCLAYLLKNNAKGEIIDRDFRITLIKDKIAFTSNYSGYISVYAYTPHVLISIHGLKYTLDHSLLTSDFPLGLDNEFIGKSSSIEVHEGAALVMYRTPVEQCAGCVVLNEDNQVCMIVEKGKYLLPKGHLEEKETLKQCAIREVKEETGLDAEVIDGYEYKIEYKLSEYRPIRKEVTFFLSKTKQTKFHCNLDEVDTAYWMSIDEAIKKASKSNIKEVLIEAKKYMNI